MSVNHFNRDIRDSKFVLVDAGTRAVGPLQAGRRRTGPADEVFFEEKVATVKYFCRNISTNFYACEASMRLMDLSAMEVPEQVF